MPQQTATSTQPRAIRDRLKRHSKLTITETLNGHRPAIERDLEMAQKAGIRVPEIEVLKDRLHGPLKCREVERYLKVLGFTDDDPIVFANYSSTDTIHFRRLPGEEFDSPIDITKSFGVVSGISKPQPEDWRPQWVEWDPSIQACRQQTYGAKNDHILENRFVFTECDNGELSLNRQIEIIQEVGLPQPTLIGHSGSRSGHFFWKLASPISPDRFREVQRAIIRLLKTVPEFEVDSNLCNPSRVMRVPGSIHPKTGQRAWIHSVITEMEFTAEEIEALCPPAPSAVKSSQKPSEPTSFDAADAVELLAHIPVNPTAEQLKKLDLSNYQFWLFVGMALEWSGCESDVFEDWSSGGNSYVEGEPTAKFATFSGSGDKTISYLKWVARELSGFVQQFNPESLTGPFFTAARERTKALKQEREVAAQIENERLASLPEWERDWQWEVKASITIERLVEAAIRRKAEVENAPFASYGAKFRRYLPQKGYYETLTYSEFKKEVKTYLCSAYQLKWVDRRQIRAHRFTTDHLNNNCIRWCDTAFHQNPDRFRRDPNSIVFRNGTIYRQKDGTWRLGEHNAKNLHMSSVDGDFLEGCECPKVLKEFVRTSYGLDWLPIIRAILHYVIDPSFGCQVFIFLLGRTGSGKGTLLNLLERFYPENVRSSLAKFDEISDMQKLAQAVYGRELITFNDIQGKQTAISNLYKLCDPESVLTARRLYNNDTEQFRFNGRVLIASTSPIKLDHAGSGLMRRLLTIKTLDRPQPSTILPQDRANSGGLEKMLAAEIGAIAAWALGMPRAEVEEVLCKRHPLLRDAAMEVAANADSVNMFIDSCLVPASANTEPDFQELFSCYRLFAHHHGMRSCNTTNFKARLREALAGCWRNRRNAPRVDGEETRAKLPAGFYGFKMTDGLWRSHLNPDDITNGNFTFMKKAPSDREDWGRIDVRLMEPGGYQEMVEHDPGE